MLRLGTRCIDGVRSYRVARKHNTSVSYAMWHDYDTSGWRCIEALEDDLSSPPEVMRQYVWGLRDVADPVERQRDTTGNGVPEDSPFFNLGISPRISSRRLHAFDVRA